MARTIAQPMRWVKLILVWPERALKPLMTLRLTSSSLAGTLRKLVAVGTARLASMLRAMAAPAPRIGFPGSSTGSTLASAPFVAAGAGAAVGAAAGAGAGSVSAATPCTSALALTWGDAAAAAATLGA